MKAFIMRGEILQAEAFKPGQTSQSQLALQLEDDYTDKIILQQKYVKKVVIVLDWRNICFLRLIVTSP